MKRRIIALLLALGLVFALAGGVCAQSDSQQLPCITDTVGILSETQLARLERLAQSASGQYAVGVYLIIVEDYRQFGAGDVLEVASGLYHTYGLGEGKQSDGILLLLSMKERDYALFRYGEKACYAFSDYGLEKLEESFLDLLKNDDWEGGAEAYVRECVRYLEKAEAGKPVRESPVVSILIACGIALLLAALICGRLVRQMKTVHKQTTAAAYAAGLEVTERFDQFTHRTETRRKIERNQSSGGSRSGGRSGKF